MSNKLTVSDYKLFCINEKSIYIILFQEVYLKLTSWSCGYFHVMVCR